jgi:predicted nucleotidyltransferase component of viral defense system
MLNLSEILKNYPENLQIHRSFILREYLQYKILEILFESEFATKFCFLGGTCLRLVHNNTRFSEDLDFDNFQITENEFSKVTDIIKKGLEKQGFLVEIKQVIKGAFNCYIRFNNLLFEQGLSGYRDEKILIKIDTEPQHFDFKPEIKILNKFDVTTSIYSTPLDLLLAQKFTALCLRKKSKGRDFFDIVFLLSKSIKPNYDFLEMKLDAPNPTKLREKVLELCAQTDFNAMVADVSPFLFSPNDEKKVRLFRQIIEQTEL